MAYTDFSLETVVSQFTIDLARGTLFPLIARVVIPDWLRDTLERGRSLALLTEKSRSEFIVAPVLLTVRELSGDRIAIYSGQRFDVEPASGLIGECDFILSAGAPIPLIRAPIISVIEAKRGDIELGFGQCAAQMVASQRFNKRARPDLSTVYGCVTTGREWQFLKLAGNTLTFDDRELYLDNPGEIIAVFLAIVDHIAPPAAPAK
jgi:hypothetical protein